MQQNSMRKSEAILADLDHYKKESASQESLIVNLEKQIEKLNKQIRKLTSENLELDNGI
jgi:predicted  nucleic acid-binding Zn-ribbon protein